MLRRRSTVEKNTDDKQRIDDPDGEPYEEFRHLKRKMPKRVVSVLDMSDRAQRRKAELRDPSAGRTIAVVDAKKGSV